MVRGGRGEGGRNGVDGDEGQGHAQPLDDLAPPRPPLQAKTPEIIAMDCPALDVFKATMPVAPESCCPDLRSFITQVRRAGRRMPARAAGGAARPGPTPNPPPTGLRVLAGCDRSHRHVRRHGRQPSRRHEDGAERELRRRAARGPDYRCLHGVAWLPAAVREKREIFLTRPPAV